MSTHRTSPRRLGRLAGPAWPHPASSGPLLPALIQGALPAGFLVTPVLDVEGPWGMAAHRGLSPVCQGGRAPPDPGCRARFPRVLPKPLLPQGPG